MGSPLGRILKNGQTTRAGIAYGLRKNHAFSAPIVDETIFATKVISTKERYPVLLAISLTKGSPQASKKQQHTADSGFQVFIGREIFIGRRIPVIIFKMVDFPALFGASIYRQPPQHRINQGF